MAANGPELDFEEFHRSVLPRWLEEGRGAEVASELEGAGALAFRIAEGGAFTYRPRRGGVDVLPGEDAADTVIELGLESWQNLVRELDSPPGLLYGGRARAPRGNAMRFVRWDAALRGIYNGRPIFDPARADLRDRDGAALDLERFFTLDDDDENMAHFLRTAGYLLVRGVFSPEEVKLMREGGERVRALARKGDQESWWGKNASGEEVLCRVTTASRDEALRSLYTDPRVQRLAALADEDLTARAANSEPGVTVIYKNPEMREGLSDLPWHRDCGMGGHAINCPVLLASVFLTEGTPESGNLRFLPGSWQGACGFIDAEHPDAPRGVSPRARPGDVSLHYGDVMHAAPPPTGDGPYRMSAVMAFIKESAGHHRGERHYNDVLLGSEDGQVKHLRDVANDS